MLSSYLYWHPVQRPRIGDVKWLHPSARNTAAARLVSGFRRRDHIIAILHILPAVWQRVIFMTAVVISKCVHCVAHAYRSSAYLWKMSDVVYTCGLKYINRGLAFLPFLPREQLYASAVLVVILSVCLSVRHTRALWQNQTMHCGYLIPHERAIILVFWHQQWLVNDAPFRLKFALKVTHFFEKSRLRQTSAYNISNVRDSEIKFNYNE